MKFLAIFSTIGPARSVCVLLSVACAILLRVDLRLIGAVSAGQSTAWLPPRLSLASPALQQQASTAALAKGRFLVASRHLNDANFTETVVLLIDYDNKGAMGLIINRPTAVRLATVLPTIAALQQRPDTVSIGGPVASNRLVLLLRSNSQPTDTERVLENVYVSRRRLVLERMVDTPDAGVHFRVYAGYAGWRPGQLEREVSRGDWHIVPADAATVFDTAPADIWPVLIQKSSIRWLSF